MCAWAADDIPDRAVLRVRNRVVAQSADDGALPAGVGYASA